MHDVPLVAGNTGENWLKKKRTTETGLCGGGRSPERTGLSPVFPVNREKTGKIRNFWLNLGDLGDFCAISVSVYSELEGISLLI